SPDGNRLALWRQTRADESWAGDVRLYDLATGEELTLPGSGPGCLNAAFSADSRLLASGTREGTILLWDASSGKAINTLHGHAAGVFGVAFSPDGKRLASVGDDETVRVWDVAHGREVRTLRGHSFPVSLVAFSSDGRRILSGPYGPFLPDELKVWDVEADQEVRVLRGGEAEPRSQHLA